MIWFPYAISKLIRLLDLSYTLYIFSIILYILCKGIYYTPKVFTYVYLCMFIYTLYIGYIHILLYSLYYLWKQLHLTLRKDIVHTICLNCALNQMEYVKREGKTIPAHTHTHTYTPISRHMVATHLSIYLCKYAVAGKDNCAANCCATVATVASSSA